MATLKFDRVESQFDLGWMASTGFGSHYFIRIDRETGRTIIRTLDNKDVIHDNVDNAKQWCIEDYNKRFKEIHENQQK